MEGLRIGDTNVSYGFVEVQKVQISGTEWVIQVLSDVEVKHRFIRIYSNKQWREWRRISLATLPIA